MAAVTAVRLVSKTGVSREWTDLEDRIEKNILRQVKKRNKKRELVGEGGYKKKTVVGRVSANGSGRLI